LSLTAARPVAALCDRRLGADALATALRGVNDG